MGTTKVLQLILLGVLALVYESSAQTGQNLTWWQNTIIYQIYPRSFKDSDGDGVGDLKGITSKLDYFTWLGVDSFWLSPIYKSPMKDFGYDISDYTDIDPVFGTLQDFDDLVQAAHSKGLNVIMDYVPGHTSTEHEWFKKSVKREGKYTNYYIWNDGILLPNGTRTVPNNWLSVFGGTAWAWNEERQQYYYHAFVEEQADLNYRDDNVQWEMREVLRFWLDKGVDGFRVDAIVQLYEVENVSMNEDLSGQNVPSFQYEFIKHEYTNNLPETFPTVSSWNDVLKEYEQKDGKDRYMIIEVYDDPAIRNQYYATGGDPFNFDLIDISPNPTGMEIRDRVMREYINLPSGKWPNFVLGNHDRRRVSYKFGREYVDLYNMLLLTLWGTPTTYYGEEIGMMDTYISYQDTVDPWGLNFGPTLYEQFSRDPERTPMQWTSGDQAGFTTGNSTWLPLGDNYTMYNVQTEQDAAGPSSIKLYQQLAQLRKTPVFHTGTFTVAAVDTNIFSFIRELNGDQMLVALNVGKQEATTDFSSYSSLPTAQVIALTPGVQNYNEHQAVQLTDLKLSPGDGLVLQIKDTSIVG